MIRPLLPAKIQSLTTQVARARHWNFLLGRSVWGPRNREFYQSVFQVTVHTLCIGLRNATPLCPSGLAHVG
jgi:hypothetical protein